MKNSAYDYKSVDDIKLMHTNEKCRLQKCTWIIHSNSVGVEANTISNHLNGSWIAPKVSSLGAETTFICLGL